MLAELLRRDPGARLVLVNNSQGPDLPQQLLARLRRHLPAADERVDFLPFLRLGELLGLAPQVDAVLDTPVFGGGTTSLEMFAVDVPVVTWPGPFARSRITHALYRQMGIDGLTAHDAASYVDIALRLAQDPAWRAAKRDELRCRKGVLYENAALVRELEAFLAAAVAAAAQGGRLPAGAPPPAAAAATAR